ncbi:hypothetical protein K443DRAFT_489475 [Laccaria amethystina LaAM-08-1]|uniref:Uncharacterized protein n=1 Tax=Laccaria amethystina LaAM-08-1 TaxID=1095629 RepID=A0A0C9XE73_9AGAR|nr:hypothetical protein K443DRAFT_489475 [Laccaria amethystina LaAM-08-1]
MRPRRFRISRVRTAADPPVRLSGSHGICHHHTRSRASSCLLTFALFVRRHLTVIVNFLPPTYHHSRSFCDTDSPQSQSSSVNGNVTICSLWRWFG